MVQSTVNKPNALHELGYKIFLDRYAQKDMTRATLTVGDTVIVVVDSKTGQREVGTVTAINLPKVTVQLNDGQVVERDLENVDKPLETQPEQMMDRVAAGIAEIERTDELRQTWTKNFRWLLDDWKFVPGGRILTGAGTDQKLTYYNCMPPSQEVLTQHGYRPIAEVQVGDYVVTHRNRLRKVLHKFERETEEALYIFNAQKIGYDALRLTGEHRVLVIRSEWVNTHKSGDGLRLAQAPAWIPASEIRVGDFVAVAHNAEVRPLAEIRLSDYIGVDCLLEAERHYQPYSTYTVVGEKLAKSRVQPDGSLTLGKLPQPLNNQLTVDADLMFLFGRWLGDGCVTHRTGTDIPSGIKIVFNLDERAEAERIAAIVEAKFGVPAALKLSSTERWLDLWVDSMPVGEFFKAFFGAYSYAKMIPAELMQLPDAESLALLRGIFSADGYMSGNSIGLLLANRTLATQIHQMLLRLGYFFSIKESTHKNGRTPAYRLHATANECAPLFEALFDTAAPPYDVDLRYYIQHDDLRWVRVQSIDVETYRGIVMDMEVDEDHSFVSAGLVVSNCYVIPSPKDSRSGIIATLEQMTEIMSRGGGVGINISSLRPRHAYVKGVNGRSSGSVSWGALYSFVTGLIEQGGSRRGALMLILNDWHPDVFNFINSKREAGNITNANISVGISDRFMEALKADADWDLVFPDTSAPDYDETWDGDLEAWQAKGGKVIHYKTIKARELWDAIIESAWASAEPGVWFRERSNKMSNSWYFSPLISTNPCGEQPLSAWSVCNLGAINLAKFYDPATNDVAWDTLDRTVRYAVRFLDNVIDSTPYFFEENERKQGSERRVGLGTMGVAELMLYCGVRYGSDESVAFIEKLYKAIAIAAYETSADLAAEKGAFEAFDAEKVLQSGFMRQMPEDVRQRVKEKGLRNVTLLTQAPTGCVAPDTLVSTEQGMMPIVAMGDPNGPQWQIMNRRVYSDTGLEHTSHFYVNGLQPVKKITTRRGFSITATHNHRLRVIDHAGRYVWRRMDEMQVGDRMVLKRGTLGEGESVALKPVEQGNRAMSALPAALTPEFAELLGLYMGDGYTKKRGGLHIVVSKRDADLVTHVQQLMRQVWGERQIGVEERQGCWTVNLTGYYIGRFFEANGLAKPTGNRGEGAAGAFIPQAVLRGGKRLVAAFLRGLFEADGSVTRGTITLATTSATLAKQVQIALLGLGIVATLRQLPPQEGHKGERAMYEVRVLNRREAARFAELVGFISERKRAKLADLGAISDRGDSIAEPVLLQEFYAVSQGLPNEVRQRMVGLVSNGALTQHYVKEMIAEHPQLLDSRLAQLVNLDIFLDDVADIADGMSYTYDISVPSNQTYIANGFVSHNTTGTMVNTSTGIEPFFSWVYYRKSRLGLHEEQVPVVADWYAKNPGAEKLPDHFVTAMDLSPEEHVKVQGAFQRWIDSAISKTCNVPNHYSVEQVSQLYLQMYDLGCKGGTIYRDGSRSEQVLMLKGDERAEKEMEGLRKEEKAAPEPVLTPHKEYPRPVRLTGTTVKFRTPFGTSYITMNNDEHGNPFEVFITVGKAGSDIQADAEAMGRMISLQLRTTAPHNRREMLRLIMEQLQGIGGARPTGIGSNRVLSLPDAVANAIAEYYFKEDAPQQLGLPMAGVEPVAPVQNRQTNGGFSGGSANVTLSTKEVVGFKSGADMCPECGTISLIRAEGCRRCTTCDYTEC